MTKIPEKLKKQFILNEDSLERINNKLWTLHKKGIAVVIKEGVLVDVVFRTRYLCNEYPYKVSLISPFRQQAIDLFQDMVILGFYNPEKDKQNKESFSGRGSG